MNQSKFAPPLHRLHPGRLAQRHRRPGPRDLTATLAKQHDIEADRIDVFSVAGAYEIPLQAKLLAKSGRYDAIVGADFVIDGGIYRHDFVAQAVINSMMRAQLDTEVPVLCVVLTPHHFHEHATHTTFYHEHFLTKGREAADACAMTLESLYQARQLTT